jgi:hypothetical protein
VDTKLACKQKTICSNWWWVLCIYQGGISCTIHFPNVPAYLDLFVEFQHRCCWILSGTLLCRRRRVLLLMLVLIGGRLYSRGDTKLACKQKTICSNWWIYLWCSQCGLRSSPRLRPRSLFLYYINDLQSRLTSTVRLFADDTIAYLTISNIYDAETLQKDLDKLGHWENAFI